MRFIRAALVLLVVCAAVGPVLAQTGGLRVVVVDEAGQTLPGATVVLSNDQGFIKQTASLTDAKGEVLFPVLRAGGGYVVEVSMPSFATQRFDVRVKINETQTVKSTMLQEIQETVVVTAESNVVDLDKTERSTKFTDEFIQDLPVPGRFYQGVLTMAPGVQDDDGDGEVTVHGSRARDFRMTVGGVSNVDPLTGQTLALVNPNSIEEMEVVTSGAGVEFGRAQGGFGRIIQKQGSNEFEGLAEVIYQSYKLNGDGAGNIRSDFLPEFQWFQPSVQVSGPIVKDKVWYRLSHEYIDRDDPINAVNAVYVVTTEQGINSDQVTWQVSPRNKLALNYDYNPLTVNNIGVSSRTPPASAAKQTSDFQALRLTWTAPFSPKVFFESIAAYQQLDSSIGPSDDAALTNECVNDTSNLRFARCADLELQEVSGPFPFRREATTERFTANSQVTIFAGQFLGSSHQLKIGLSVENERYTQDIDRRPDLQAFLFSSIEDNQEGGQVEISRRPVLFGQFAYPNIQRSGASATYWSAFVQDQIKPRQNLTITAGILLDRESTTSPGQTVFDPAAELNAFYDAAYGQPTEVQTAELARAFTAYAGFEDFSAGVGAQIGPGVTLPQGALQQFYPQYYRFQLPEDINIVNTNVSPRISIAWDPWSNGKTKFAASAGRFYNSLPLTVPLQEQNPLTALLEIDCTSGNCVPIGEAAPSFTFVDRNLRTPYQDEWTVSFERELFAETLLRVTYINRKFRDQIQDIDVNHAPGDYGRCQLQTVPGQPVILPVDDPDDPLYGMFPNGGDGIIDDCAGSVLFLSGEDPDGGEGGGPAVGGISANSLVRPDGLPDLYQQNPNFQDIYYVGNFNSSDYDAITLEIVRRQYRGWELQGSYTWSESIGDGEDFFQRIGDDQSLFEDERGYQSTDRRHVVKLNATTITPWGFRFGTAISWQSGLPYSVLTTQLSRDSSPPVLQRLGLQGNRQRFQYPSGVRNDQRNTPYWNVDVKATKELRVGQRANMQLSAEIFNLLNDGTYQVFNPGISIGQQIDGINDATRRFGRTFQVGAKVTF